LAKNDAIHHQHMVHPVAEEKETAEFSTSLSRTAHIESKIAFYHPAKDARRAYYRLKQPFSESSITSLRFPPSRSPGNLNAHACGNLKDFIQPNGFLAIFKRREKYMTYSANRSGIMKGKAVLFPFYPDYLSKVFRRFYSQGNLNDSGRLNCQNFIDRLLFSQEYKIRNKNSEFVYF
jgi:hypothetical protein